VRHRFLRVPTGFGDPAEVQLGLGGVEVVVRREAPEVPLCVARPAVVEQQLADPVAEILLRLFPDPVGRWKPGQRRFEFGDDRGAAGAGESSFRRGLCWTGPITRVTAA
jgi:hypothetical protein